MDAVSWPKQRKTKLAMTMDVALRALCAVGWLVMVASCTNQSPVHENFDTLDDAHDIQGEESVEESMDVVQSDSEEALKNCDPRNVLPLACEVLESWWWEGEEAQGILLYIAAEHRPNLLRMLSLPGDVRRRDKPPKK